MILPNKYLEVKDSFIYQAALFLKLIDNKEYTIDTLWVKYQKKYTTNQINYTYYIYLLTFMYITGMINYKNGVIYNENIRN